MSAGDETTQMGGPRGSYRFEQVRVDPAGGDMIVEAGPDGASIADISAYAQP